MKIAYIAHPISGDVKGNLKKLVEINRKINLEEPDVLPFIPYFVDCKSLDDSIPEERARGIKNDTFLINKGFIDEVRLYGGRISPGMAAEAKLAHDLGIDIKPIGIIMTSLYRKLKMSW